MRRSLIISILSITIFILTRQTSHAFGFDSVQNAIKNVGKISDSISVMFPFGGEITSTGTACKVRFWVWTNTIWGPIPCPNCGFIPIAGTVIDVEEPGIPASQVFTFPGITKIYANRNEDKVGAMTIGLALKPYLVKRITNRINSALSKIPAIPLPTGWADHFNLACPSGGIIRQIGTSSQIKK